MTIPQLHMYDLKTGEYTAAVMPLSVRMANIFLRRLARRPLLARIHPLRPCRPLDRGCLGDGGRPPPAHGRSVAARKAGRSTGFPAIRGVLSPVYGGAWTASRWCAFGAPA